mmetsp:Transcript_76651/g.135243  ORF Transcript_76651/g.135243 Transcript_76651/m.135243 type:complete len:509 (-) Transcript_76651:132-1658(-)
MWFVQFSITYVLLSSFSHGSYVPSEQRPRHHHFVVNHHGSAIDLGSHETAHKPSLLKVGVKKPASLTEVQDDLKPRSAMFAQESFTDEDGDRYNVHDTADCPHGWRLVTGFQDCRKAALGFQKTFSGLEAEGSARRGCQYRHRLGEEPRLFFNTIAPTSDAAISTQKSWPVCVRSPQSSQLLVEKGVFRAHEEAEAEAEDDGHHHVDPKKIKIFCFAWTTWQTGAYALLPEVRRAMDKCDGHAIFSNELPTGVNKSDVIAVSLPEQQTPPTDARYLYHRNMVGLMPTWDHILKSNIADDYDWLVNIEFDHMMIPSKLRNMIAEYTNRLENGKIDEQLSVNKSMMLMFGNAFLFNAKMLRQMREEWPTLGKVAPPSEEAKGCPMWMKGKMEWPDHCSQDVAYPTMVTMMKINVPAYGDAGCGHKPDRFPLPCYELQSGYVAESGLDQVHLAMQMAVVQGMADEEAAKTAYKGSQLEQFAKALFDSKDVPLIHHFNDALARKVARELMDP